MKAILFFSDINNTMTISPILSGTEYKKEIEFFVEKLNQIKEIYDASKVMISFSTSYRIGQFEKVRELLDLLFVQASENGLNLELSKVFMSDGELKFEGNYNEFQIEEVKSGDRLVQLANHIKQLKKENVEVIWTGYADDNYPVHEHGEERLKNLGVNVFYNGFMPTVFGANVLDENVFVSSKPTIIGLNEAMGNFVLENKCRRR